jgi:hypothetical protein
MFLWLAVEESLVVVVLAVAVVLVLFSIELVTVFQRLLIR